MLVEAVRNTFAGWTIDGTNPSDPAISKMLGLGMETTAGVQVSHERVMAIPAIKRGVQIVTDKMFGMPWYVFRKDSEDNLSYDKSHPSWRCMTSRANPELSDAALRQQLVQWAMTYGNGCAAIYRPAGWPDSGNVELVPLLPDRTRLVRVPAAMAEKVGDPSLSGQLLYETTVGGQLLHLQQDNVFHIRGLGPNPYWGWDIVSLMVECFGGTIAKESYSNRYFGQGATPAGFLEMEGTLDEEGEENRAESIAKSMQGLGNAHRFAILEEGMKFKPFAFDPKKSQMLEGRQYDVRLMSMVIGVKAHKLIDGANSAFASLEQANQEHKDDDIIPWVNKWRKEAQLKLLTEQQQQADSHTIDVDDEFLEWVPFADRARGVVELYNNGLIEKDEGRRKVNYGPSKANKAKMFRIPSNIVYEDDMPAGSSLQGQQDPPEPPDESPEPAGQTTAPPEQITGPQQPPEPSPEAIALDELRQHSLSGIRKRLAKQAQAKAKHGAAKFLGWLDELTTEQGAAVIQSDIDATYTDFRATANRIAEQATTDDELRSLLDEI